MSIGSFFKKVIKFVLGKVMYQRHIKSVRKDQRLRGNYGSLAGIAEYDSKKFIELKRYNDRKNEEELRKKDIIKVGFVTYTSSTWNIDALYKLLSNNDKFNVEIIVGHSPAENKALSEDEFKQTISYFSKLGYLVVQAGELEKIEKYDMLFFLDPTNLSERQVKLFGLPLKILIFHTSYSFMLSGNERKVGMWMYHLAYKYYTDSMFYKKRIEQYRYSTNNVEFLGFPKMDQYYLANYKKRTEKKVIIYAPHHSVDYSRYRSATFQDNYQIILELAQKYKDETFWIYKPHPRLRYGSIKAGVFKDMNGYEEYVNQWRMLPNAEVVEIGDYFPVFKESDGMITDSISFLAEYQFTHKPLLLLESGEEEYNEFGQSIVNILYKCSGKDDKSIESFIRDCISGVDSMYDERKVFFEKNLDYMKDGEFANLKIYNQIIDILK